MNATTTAFAKAIADGLPGAHTMPASRLRAAAGNVLADIERWCVSDPEGRAWIVAMARAGHQYLAAENLAELKERVA